MYSLVADCLTSLIISTAQNSLPFIRVGMEEWHPESDTSLATWTLVSLNHRPYAALSETTQVGIIQSQRNKLVLSIM